MESVMETTIKDSVKEQSAACDQNANDFDNIEEKENNRTAPRPTYKTLIRPFTSKTKVCGVEFAPVIIPLERRLQTLAVIGWTLIFWVFAVGGWIISLCITLLTPLGVFIILYVAWIYQDRKTAERGGRRIMWVRNAALWRYYRDYFPIKMVTTAKLDTSKNYLFCSHPHGVLSSGVFTCFATEALNIGKIFEGFNSKLLTLPMNFNIPFFREIMLGLGACSASRSSMNHILSRQGGGNIALLVPGGAAEALDSHPGSYIVQLKNKKGFIKVAIQNGSPIVPVFSFGETDIFFQPHNPRGSFLRAVQEKFRSITSFSPVLYLGRGIFQYNFGILPFRHPINVVVGQPIEVTKNDNPSQEEIDDLHSRYVSALIKLYGEHKDVYDVQPSNKLIIT